MTSKNVLIDSARTEILRYDHAGARVDRIAKLAGINKRMIYHYFGSKEGVYREVLQQQLALLSSELAPVPSVLRSVCRNYLFEIGSDFVDKLISQQGTSSLSSEDYKIAAIICFRAILSLEGHSSIADSRTLNYIKSLDSEDRDELCGALMGLIFHGDLDSLSSLRPKVVKLPKDSEAKKNNKPIRQIVANTRHA